ncbi:MAG: type II secretion system protein, partial [Clostridia bacterium]|nr:type II secretion system protein [Clostridia bacterium]
MRKADNRRGFTIVELVIVIAVVAILAAVLIPTFSSIVDKANTSQALQEARNTYTEYLIASDGVTASAVVVSGGDKFFVVKDGAIDTENVYEDKETAGAVISADFGGKQVAAGVYSAEVPEYVDSFADNTWAQIINMCQKNEVPATWNVGDTKTMTIGGTEYNIVIIGKNHDTYSDGSGKAPLTFKLAEVYGTPAKMNETQTNTTGWSGSAMRNTTMTEILAAMPSEVQNAVKAVDKETLNGTRDGLETTSDKLFLLSEIEVNGSVSFSNN